MNIFVAALLAGILFVTHSGCSLESKVARANEKYMKRAPFDVVIVPGYPYREEKNRILFNTRIFFAKELFEKGIAKNIIFSGAAVHTPYGEGKIMKIFADSLGLPHNHTFVEDKALHSNENALYGVKMAKKMGFKNIAIATDPYQFSYMTLLMAFYTPKAAILTFYPRQMPEYDKQLPAIDTTDVFVKNFVPLD